MLAAVLTHSSQELDELTHRAAERSRLPGAYAGEVTPLEAWEYVNTHADSLLIDVRTLPEWQFTGVPDMSTAAGKFTKISWKNYPSFALNQDFINAMAREEISKDTPLFFLCRSGGRSLDAAISMTAQGYTHCFNIMDGFEGEPDVEDHRGVIAGWKASGLPWRQG